MGRAGLPSPRRPWALKERYPFIRGFVEMDCKSIKGIAKLKAALCEEVDHLKWVREPFPETWDAVRRALTKGDNKRAAPHLYRIPQTVRGAWHDG